MRTRLAVHLLAVMSLASFVYAGEPDPKQILDKVAAQYESLQTYEAEGTVVTDIETGRGSMHMETSFSMKLKKPNLYLITWTQKGMPMSGMEQSGAVWNAGAQPCLYMGIMKAYSKMTSDEIALGAATGISGGAAFTIPWLFFSVLGPKHGAILQLADPKIEKIEKLDGEECYVVSGSSPISRKETFWISTRRLLILQFSRSLEPPAGRPAQQDLTDKELDEAIKGLGQEPTPEARATMKEILKQGQETLKNAKIKGTSCEHHLKISSPQLSQADFQFKVPEGTALEDSLFNLNMGEGTTGAKKEAISRNDEKAGLSDDAARKAEEQLQTNPDDLSLRSRLLEYYSSKQFESRTARKVWQRHVLWLIEHHPEAAVLGQPYGELDSILDGEAFVQGKKLWLKHVEEEPKNLDILGNAADYFLICETDTSEQLLQKAKALDPKNPKWSSRLGHLYALGMNDAPGDARKANAAKALEQFENALRLTDNADDRAYLLKSTARAAFEAGALDKARTYAEEMLKSAASKHDPDYGNDVHQGNLILGRIALRAGDVEKAKAFLLAAGNTPGSPQLDSFGPNMTLAKELLERGEKDAVIKYLQLCDKFWESGHMRVKEWLAAIQAGNVPDFAANLDY